MSEFESVNPARYLYFYSEMSGYRFPPQSNLDEFCKLVEDTLTETLRESITKREVAIKKFGPESASSELDREISIKERIRLVSAPEGAAREAIEKLQLMDEMRVISIYRSIEIMRANLLLKSFKWMNSEKCHKISYLQKELPYWSKVFGFAEMDEIRVINNCIKHSGRVSRQLSQFHPSWQDGKSFHVYGNFGSLHQPNRPLRDAYQRLAPYVGAYWNHFCELTKAHSPQDEKPISDLMTEEYLLELIRSGKDLQFLLDEDP